MNIDRWTTLVVVFGLLVIASSFGRVRPYHRWWYRTLGTFICIDAISFREVNQLELALQDPAYIAFKIAVILEAVLLTAWLCHINTSQLDQQWNKWNAHRGKHGD